VPTASRTAIVLGALVLLLVVAPSRSAGAVPHQSESGRPEYRPPVERPVADPFRLPSGPYGPGNRGLEYATAGGEVARAIGPGVVAFAGPVAGRLVVSVEHPDGLRSTLTGLRSVAVRPRERVVTGSPLGRAGPALHLGVRRGRTYLDPATLFGRSVRPRRAVLVPVPAAPGPRWGARDTGR
jgi:murein DD-endopeptidase MepM/ murein hydrolase activator NlpD